MRGFYKRFLSTGLAVAGLASTFGAPAAEFSGSVPADPARYLSGGGRLYRTLPPDFPVFDMPAGLRVIGSHDRENIQQVLLRSQPEGLAAQEAVVAAFLEEGWLDMQAAEEARPYGFIVPVTGTNFRPAMLCHDEHGSLEVRGESGVENRVYLQRFIPRNLPGLAGRPGCQEQLLARQDPGGGAPAGIADEMRYAPELRPPARPLNRAIIGVRNLIARAGYASGGSGGGSFYETDLFARAEDSSLREVAEHYAGQMREQGWEADARWDGAASAGGTWTRRPEEDLRLFVTLQIRENGTDSYTIRINMGRLE